MFKYSLIIQRAKKDLPAPIDPFKNNLILFYGQNEGLKDENILKLSSKFHNIIKYHEREVLENQDNFFESVFSGSLFDEDKFVIINQASDKIVKIVEILIEKKEIGNEKHSPKISE